MCFLHIFMNSPIRIDLSIKNVHITHMNDSVMISVALRRLFRPLARLAISKGVIFKDAQNALKQAFVDTAERDFQIDGKRLTDSRISLLTGLQRRDIRQISENETLAEIRHSPLQRLHSHLLAHQGSTLSMEKFDALARSLYQDIHPRTFLDELLRLQLIKREGDDIFVENRTLIGQDFGENLDIMVDNLSAHLSTSVSNVLGAPPQLEQAVYVQGLTKASAKILEGEARARVQNLLIDLNQIAVELQEEEMGDIEIRIGVYLNEK